MAQLERPSVAEAEIKRRWDVPRQMEARYRSCRVAAVLCMF